MTKQLSIRSFTYQLSLIVLCLGLSACGGYESTLTDAERAVYEKFVGPEVATLDDTGFSELIEARKELTTGTAAMKMSADETEKATAQIEAMIARLEKEVAEASDAKEKRSKSRELYELKKAIGRGGA